MKQYIVRAPQTDRYTVEVPTKASELIQDLPGSTVATLNARLNLLCYKVLTTDPTPLVDYPAAGALVCDNVGFADPLADPLGPVVVTFPETGIYLVTANVACYSETDLTGA